VSEEGHHRSWQVHGTLEPNRMLNYPDVRFHFQYSRSYEAPQRFGWVVNYLFLGNDDVITFVLDEASCTYKRSLLDRPNFTMIYDTMNGEAVGMEVGRSKSGRGLTTTTAG
jgi:hypothetical protein